MANGKDNTALYIGIAVVLVFLVLGGSWYMMRDDDDDYDDDDVVGELGGIPIVPEVIGPAVIGPPSAPDIPPPPPSATTYVVKSARNPHRVIIGPEGMRHTGSGWKNRFTFKAYKTQQPGTAEYCVGIASNPTRTFLRKRANCGGSGWTHRTSFWAYPSKGEGRIPISVGFHPKPHRVMLHKGKTSAEGSGWKHRIVFYTPK